MGMPTKEEKESGTTIRGMEEGEGAQWGKRATSKGSSNVYERVDGTKRSSDICGVQRM